MLCGAKGKRVIVQVLPRLLVATMVVTVVETVVVIKVRMANSSKTF